MVRLEPRSDTFFGDALQKSTHANKNAQLQSVLSRVCRFVNQTASSLAGMRHLSADLLAEVMRGEHRLRLRNAGIRLFFLELCIDHIVVAAPGSLVGSTALGRFAFVSSHAIQEGPETPASVHHTRT